MEPVTSPDYDASVTLKFKTNKRRRGWGFRCYVDSEEQSFSPNATTTTTTAAPGVTTTTSSNGNTENCQCGVKNSGNRIVGGVETEANEYPWQVALVSSSGSRPFCGGTLISNQHVLTAAHCTAGSSASGISVLLGEHRIDDSSFNRVPLSKITDHPNYNNGNLDNDFSILTLATPVEFSNTVAPACLPTSGANVYARVTAQMNWIQSNTVGTQFSSCASTAAGR